MKQDYFTTPVYKGTFEFNDSLYKKYQDWIEFEKTLDPEGVAGSTTHNGYQIGIESLPDWIDPFYKQIKNVQQDLKKLYIKGSWFVEYKSGGYQDPHFHPTGKIDAFTVIFNIRGKGELVLYDPRQLAVAEGAELGVTEILNDCEWIAIPTWLTHSSRPCETKRSIFVLDLV
jgi:hypothetical protein